jgi:hypothetical protein
MANNLSDIADYYTHGSQFVWHCWLLYTWLTNCLALLTILNTSHKLSNSADYCRCGSQVVWHWWLLYTCLTSCLTVLTTAQVAQKFSDIADYFRCGSQVVWHCWLLYTLLTSCLTALNTAKVAQKLFLTITQVSDKLSDTADYYCTSCSQDVWHYWLLRNLLTRCLTLLTTAQLAHKISDTSDYCTNSTQSDKNGYCTQIPSISCQLYRTLSQFNIYPSYHSLLRGNVSRMFRLKETHRFCSLPIVCLLLCCCNLIPLFSNLTNSSSVMQVLFVVIT